MLERIFSLKLNIDKLTACYSSLLKHSKAYRNTLLQEKEMGKDKCNFERIINLLTCWIVSAVLLLINGLAGISSSLYEILYFVNFGIFFTRIVINVAKVNKILNKYDNDLADSYSSMMRVTNTIMAFQESLKRRYYAMLDELSEEDKHEYEEYVKEHNHEADEILLSVYSLDEISEIINAIVTEDNNNITEDDYQKYTEATNDYLDHIAIVMSDYLLDEHIERLQSEQPEENEEEKRITLQ